MVIHQGSSTLEIGDSTWPSPWSFLFSTFLSCPAEADQVSLSSPVHFVLFSFTAIIALVPRSQSPERTRATTHTQARRGEEGREEKRTRATFLRASIMRAQYTCTRPTGHAPDLDICLIMRIGLILAQDGCCIDMRLFQLRHRHQHRLLSIGFSASADLSRSFSVVSRGASPHEALSAFAGEDDAS